MIKLIGITGPARSGKSTLANELGSRLGYAHNAFADPIKSAMYLLFGWSREFLETDAKELVDPKWGFTPRLAMQTLGTEWARGLDPDLWVKIAEKERVKAMRHADGVVISDVRFENEAAFIRNNEGLIVHLSDSAWESPSRLPAKHASEKGVRWKDNDWIVTGFKSRSPIVVAQQIADFCLKFHKEESSNEFKPD